MINLKVVDYFKKIDFLPIQKDTIDKYWIALVYFNLGKMTGQISRDLFLFPTIDDIKVYYEK